MKLQTDACRCALLATAAGLALPLAAHAQEASRPSPSSYYEEDAWYDVSEWFEGNDYNPADEAIGAWDDEEVSGAREGAQPGRRSAGDAAGSAYGYEGDPADDWYYDYSDYEYSDWMDVDLDEMYEYSSQYYDYDDDGIYDAFASFYDTDGDGLYEDTRYYRLSRGESGGAAPQQDAAARGNRIARKQSISGAIEAIKKVKTPGGDHAVVRVKSIGSGASHAVDLGPAEEIAEQLALGNQLTATGPLLEVGDHQVLLAQRVEMAGQERQIDRSKRRFRGTILDTRTVPVQGNEHQLVKLETDRAKKLLVDLGPKQTVKLDLRKGQQLQVQGPAVRIGDRRVLVARSFAQAGQNAETQQSPGLPRAVSER